MVYLHENVTTDWNQIEVQDFENDALPRWTEILELVYGAKQANPDHNWEPIMDLLNAAINEIAPFPPNPNSPQSPDYSFTPESDPDPPGGSGNHQHKAPKRLRSPEPLNCQLLLFVFLQNHEEQAIFVLPRHDLLWNEDTGIFTIVGETQGIDKDYLLAVLETQDKSSICPKCSSP